MANISPFLFDNNPLLWGRYNFPIHFRMVSPDFHYDMAEAVEANQNLAVVAPRGSAKSTVITFLKCMHSICFKKKHFIVIVQNTYAKAAGTLETIKEEVRVNERFKYDFPLVLKKDAEGDSVFRYPGPGWECRVLCKGADQIGSIRGEKFGAFRPDLIILDDLEDDKSVKNPELRKELERLFFDVLKYAGDGKETQTICVGTILHDDCLISKLVDPDRYKQFKKMRFKARLDDGSSLWPEKWSVEDLKVLEEQDPESFAKEMQGDPSSGIYEDFRKDDFRYWSAVGSDALLRDEGGAVVRRFSMNVLKPAIAVDLAWDEKRASDSSVLMPGYLTPDNDILVDDYISKKGMRPDEVEEALFSRVARMEKLTGENVPIGMEKAKLEKVVKWLMEKAMRRRGKFLWLKDLKWDGDKITRIVVRLSNRYRMHTVYHKYGMGVLEQQLMRIRSTAHDDEADCVQGLAQLLENPRKMKPVPGGDDKFERLRQWAIEKKYSINKPVRRSPFIHTRSGRFPEIPSTTCPI